MSNSNSWTEVCPDSKLITQTMKEQEDEFVYLFISRLSWVV